MKMRGKLPRLYGSDGELDTPFRRAADEWDRRMGSSVVQARNWRFAALLAVMGWLGTSGGLVVLAQRPAAVRLVTIDRDGVPVSNVRPVAAEAFVATDDQIKHYLRQWIIDARQVSSDAGVTKKGWLRAHARAIGTASSEFVNYLKPFGSSVERSKKVMITIDEKKLSIIRVTEKTYQADWTEKLWKPNASEPVVSTHRGLHQIHLRPPPADDPDNAIGFYVGEYHWSQLR